MEALAEAVMIQFRGTNPDPPEPGPEPQILGTMQIAEHLEDFDCPVCWNTITEGEKKVQTSCNHTLCTDCVPRLSCLPSTTTCVACPMCRTNLKKYTVPLRKVPLHKIRKELQKQNQIVAMHQYHIQHAPDLINYYSRKIYDAILKREQASRELVSTLEYQLMLQEEVNVRARPRRQNSSVEQPVEQLV